MSSTSRSWTGCAPARPTTRQRSPNSGQHACGRSWSGPPLLAEFLARLPDQRARDLCLSLLAAAVIAAWTIRLGGSPLRAALNLAILYLGVGICVTLQGPIDLLHEAWSGLLIALSLAVRGDRRFMASVAFGLLAALIRELAFPYLAIMSAFAFIEGKRAEAAAFAAALGVAVIALVFHGLAVTLSTGRRPRLADLADLAGLGLLSELMWSRIGSIFR